MWQHTYIPLTIWSVKSNVFALVFFHLFFFYLIHATKMLLFCPSFIVIHRLALRLVHTPSLAHDFFIDASHELAMFAWNEGNGIRLSARSSFICAKREERCALYPAPLSDCVSVLGNASYLLIPIF
jgi:hypothetical protein